MPAPARVHPADQPDPQEVAALHECLVRLLERQDPAELLRELADRAAVLAGTRHAYVYLLDRETDELVVTVGTGMFERRLGYRLAAGQGVAGRVLASGDTLVVEDYRTWAGHHPDLRRDGFRAVVGVPLTDGTGVSGVLGLAYDDARSFRDAQVHAVTRFAQLASLALQNARLLEEARVEVRERRAAEEELYDAVGRLRRSEQELQRSQQEMITRLANAAESRSSETGRHVERMSMWCERLARHMGLDDDFCDLLRLASPLHDIGKLGIPDEILLKPGALSGDERAVVETHAELGRRLLGDSSSEILELASTIAWTHHERYDGLGYPRRLRGADIPLEGRIAAVADVFDALTSDRVYRPAIEVGEALRMMREGRGTQFDPVVLDAFLEIAGEEMPAYRDLAAVSATRPGRRRRDRLTRESLAAARDAACAAIHAHHGRSALDAALEALHASCPSLLVSVYAEEHGRLWCVSQSGYARVRDGFSVGQGIIGRAARTGETQWVPDIGADGDFVEAVDSVVSELAFPLRQDGATMGVFNLESLATRLPASAGDIVLPLVGELERALGEIRSSLEVDLTHLARLCVHASSLRGVPAISEFAARTVGRLLELDSVQLNLLAGGDLRLVAYWSRSSFPGGPLDAERVRAVIGPAPEAIAYNAVGGGAGEALQWIPLRSGGRTIGAIVGRSSGESPSQERVEAATLFGQHAAALLDVAQALRRERRAATTDSLTGLLNRRGFEARFAEEREHAGLTREPLALLLCDCDGLKDVNDTFGHEYGDRMLHAIATTIRTAKRVEDVAARLGGDEFAVLLPRTSCDGAVQLASRILAELSGDGGPGSPSVSVGVACGDEGSVDDLLPSADRALYEAKAAGGRCHRVATRPVEAPA